MKLLLSFLLPALVIAEGRVTIKFGEDSVSEITLADPSCRNFVQERYGAKSAEVTATDGCVLYSDQDCATVGAPKQETTKDGLLKVSGSAKCE